MACTPQELMQLAKCFSCLPNTSVSDLYTLCAWANHGQPPEEQGRLLEDEGGFFLFDDGGYVLIQT